MNERRTTLADVARKAGVHVTTVSLALRNHPRLPQETRTRIQKLAERMGYRPDPYLQALVAYRSKTMPRRNPPTLAYVTNWNTRFGWQKVTAHPQFYAGAAAKAQDLGFKLEHFWMSEPGLTQARLNRILETRGINGLIIASHMREQDVALEFDWAHFSAVKIDYFPHQPGLHNVTNNQCSIIRLALRQVLAAGYKRIGFVMHRGWDHSVDHLWSAGFLCEQANVPVADRIPMLMFPEAEPVAAWMAESQADVTAPTAAFQRWFRKYEPEVVISKSSFVQPCFAELGLRVPRDLAFVDVFLEDTARGRIAGVRQNHEEVGGLAVEILAGQLHHNKFGVPEIPTTTFVAGTWFDGASCPNRRQQDDPSATLSASVR
ncbi:LacI family DNA-binding transcriptional regulator [Opitutus sp. ER46]|uniref:LacI family DNA-binding transcriptional regulator n=1 Tax=Opitutus sp. ER46 TaxID=2161864 RepID=UPI000D2FF391|nr:LacI family DNA-binding transcriptional regulator [Opitutus sp. ER46]PTX91556.1 LacI family transcriptional regulator [Opitutus sp. ER46]